MIENFECPVCNHIEWNIIENFKYTVLDHKQSRHGKFRIQFRKLIRLWKILIFAKPSKKTIHCRDLDRYQVKRREVLFNVWFPESKTVEVKTKYCGKCGFGCFTPRPDENDIAAKYQYLKLAFPDQGGQTGQGIYAKGLDYKRALRIHDLTINTIKKKKIRILDYGGGNGKLLIPFLTDGHECYIVDYNDHPVQGVKKIGNNIHDMDRDITFDIILCSHVLEHVSDIGSLLSALRQLLNQGGVLYTEVPHEIWAGIYIDADPVTHINYFTSNSLNSLLIINGFRILQNKRVISNYGKSFMDVIWALSSKTEQPVGGHLIADTRSLLYPSRIGSLIKVYKMFIWPKINEIRYSMSTKLGQFLTKR